ncbi:MAG: hypothetical protein V2I43_09810 [Parvularcula sp.]|nr:hypothetical protein [Parvularcula sp.]
MFDHIFTTGPRDVDDRGIARQIAHFLQEHGPALETAAELLGGPPWRRRVTSLCGNLAAGCIPLQRCLRELNALLALISLERVGDLGADETAYFAMVDPDDPRVHDLCLLCECLEEFVEHLSIALKGG